MLNATAQAALLQTFYVYRTAIPESQASPQPCNRESLSSWLHDKTIGDIPERGGMLCVSRDNMSLFWSFLVKV